MNQDESVKKKLKLAILGARGIGKVQARIFHSLGVEIHSILGSSMATARQTSDELFALLGVRPKAFDSLAALLEEPIDAVAVCTPPHLHFDQLIRILDRGLPAFCEKPLFWDPSFSKQQVNDRLTQLKTHPNRRLFMNAPNALFLDAVKDRFTADETSALQFSFYTNGSYTGVGIGMDLFTHGLSILYRIFGLQKSSDFSWETGDDHYKCSFKYGHCYIRFDFREDPRGDKLFSLRLNDRTFTRIQEGMGASYALYFEDSATHEKIKVEDPFIQSIQAFIRYVEAGAAVREDRFEEAEMIMRLMSENLILDKGNENH